MCRRNLRLFSALIGAFYILQATVIGQSFDPATDRTIANGSSEITGLEGQSVTIGFGVTGVTGPQFRWQRFTNADLDDDFANNNNWATITTEDDYTGIWTAELTIKELTEDPGGTEGFYRLRVRGFDDINFVSSPLVEVRTRPAVFTWDPALDDTQAVLVGQELTLSFGVDRGGDEPDFRWQKYNTVSAEWEVVSELAWVELEAQYGVDPVPDPVDIEYTVPAAELGTAGLYRLQASAVADQWESSPEITVTVIQYSIVVNGATQTLLTNNNGIVPVGFGQNVTLGYTVSRSGAPITGTTFAWQKWNSGTSTWETIAGAAASSFAISNAQLSDNGEYRLVVTPPPGQGIPETAATQIPLRVVPRIQTQPTPATTTIGIGETYSTRVFPVLGQGQLSYIWYHSRVESDPQPSDWVAISGQTTEVLVVSNAQLNSAGLYRVRIINSIGSYTQSNTVRLVVNPPNLAPYFTRQPAAVSVRAWQTIQLSGIVAGFPNPTYQWQRSTNGGVTWTNVANVVGKVTGATTNVLTITFAIPTDAAEFRLRASNSQGTVESDVVAVAVEHAPIITAQPVDVRSAEAVGQSVELTIAATGVPALLTYQWSKWIGGVWTELDNAIHTYVANEDSDTLTIAIDDAADASGRYRVVVGNTAGSIVSAEANVNVSNALAGGNTAPAFLRQPQDAAAQLGAWAIFSAQVVGNPAPGLQWQFFNDDPLVNDWEDILNATHPDLILGDLVAADAGLYRLVADNGGPPVTSDEVLLTVITGSERWDTAVEIGDSGWFYFEGEDPLNPDSSPGWFDLFYKTDADPDTIFHATHGWLFVTGEDPYASPGLWFWSSELGWFNTWQAIYPILYFAEYGWFEYLEFSIAPRWFFRIADAQWITGENIAPAPVP